MLLGYLNSNLSKDIKNNHTEREKFTTYMMSRLNYNISEKDEDDQEIDVIISKKMLEHMKSFFKEDKDSAPHSHDKISSDMTSKKILSRNHLKKSNSIEIER